MPHGEFVLPVIPKKLESITDTKDIFHSGMPRMPYVYIIKIAHITMKIGCKNTYIQKTVRGILIRIVGLILCRKRKK